MVRVAVVSATRSFRPKMYPGNTCDTVELGSFVSMKASVSLSSWFLANTYPSNGLENFAGGERGSGNQVEGFAVTEEFGIGAMFATMEVVMTMRSTVEAFRAAERMPSVVLIVGRYVSVIG